ncbi:MAG TPA: LytTR family DNA-binding domain-containing protein [Pyrinomonadaceae bacterium]|nr:LytTR family DNA-binding domain-containing protein [Pyrinomonadaceae bacterium]
MKIKTLIVDDEPLARERIRRMLQDEKDITIVGECIGGLEAVETIERIAPDLVFLDIQMPQMNGFEILQSIELPTMPVIIFVTAFDQYALKAFEFHALDYLLKPFSKDRLRSALSRAREQIEMAQPNTVDDRLSALLSDFKSENKYLERLLLKSSGRIYFVKTDEIDWIESAGNYAKLHVGQETHLLRETMSGLEESLNPENFLRIHRSCIVNIDRVKELHPLFSGDYVVIMRDNRELTLSRNYRDRLLKLFKKQKLA